MLNDYSQLHPSRRGEVPRDVDNDRSTSAREERINAPRVNTAKCQPTPHAVGNWSAGRYGVEIDESGAVAVSAGQNVT